MSVFGVTMIVGWILLIISRLNLRFIKNEEDKMFITIMLASIALGLFIACGIDLIM